MNKFAVCFHLTCWPLAYTVWLVTTTAYHPNWTLRFSCTLTLVAMSALFACFCTPHSLRFGAIAASLTALLGCGLIAALIIHMLYDWSIGPDPRRFQLSTNIVMDIVVVLFNTLCVFVLARLVQFFTGRSVWFLRES